MDITRRGLWNLLVKSFGGMIAASVSLLVDGKPASLAALGPDPGRNKFAFYVCRLSDYDVEKLHAGIRAAAKPGDPGERPFFESVIVLPTAEPTVEELEMWTRPAHLALQEAIEIIAERGRRRKS